MKKNKFVILGAVFFLISGVLQIMARTISGLAEWYAVTIYPTSKNFLTFFEKSLQKDKNYFTLIRYHVERRLLIFYE